MQDPHELRPTAHASSFPLDRLAGELGRRYSCVHVSMVHAASWPDLRLALELRAADYLAIPVPARLQLPGYYLMATLSTGLPHEKTVSGKTAAVALWAIMSTQPVGLRNHAAKTACQELRASARVMGRAGVELSEEWARLDRSLGAGLVPSELDAETNLIAGHDLPWPRLHESRRAAGRGRPSRQ